MNDEIKLYIDSLFKDILIELRNRHLSIERTVRELSGMALVSRQDTIKILHKEAEDQVKLAIRENREAIHYHINELQDSLDKLRDIRAQIYRAKENMRVNFKIIKKINEVFEEMGYDFSAYDSQNAIDE